MTRLVLLAAILGLPALATAGHCPKVRSRVVVQAQAVQYVQPQSYYAVGQAAQEDALAERIAARVLAKLEAAATVKTEAVSSLAMQHCAKCHGGPEPKAGLDLSGDLDCETRLHAIRMLLADDESKRMPKGKPLDAETLGLLIQEFATPPTQGDSP